MEIHQSKRARPTAEAPSAQRIGVSMYSTPPDMDVSMSELEESCYARLRLLRCVDHAKAKGLRGKDLNDSIKRAEQEIMRLGYGDSRPGLGAWGAEDLKRDQVAHFILRLAFCRTEDLRRYFLQNELELFRYRFNKTVDVSQFLRDNGLNYQPIDSKELADLDAQLKRVRRAVKGKDAELQGKEDHYKVPFEEVLDLVRGRRVFLRGGWAYVPKSDLISIVGSQFRTRLSRALVEASRRWPTVQEQEADRLAAFLEHCSTQYMVDDFAADKKSHGPAVSLGQLPVLSQRSFPLCMTNLHAKVKDTGHLKHQGRIQLGLFLKGIGLTYDESMTFWRTEFLKTMTGDKFDKEHRYNIRYNYGLEVLRAMTPSAAVACAHTTHRWPLTWTGPEKGLCALQLREDHLLQPGRRRVPWLPLQTLQL